MSLKVENLEHNMVKLTIEVSAEEFEKGMQSAYQKNKNRINVPGFRKGKAPRQLIEKMYGSAIFYEDAANEVIPAAYDRETADCGLELVSQPKIDVEQIGKGKPFIFTAEVAVKPEVTLGEYKGLEVPKTEISVTDEEVDAEIQKEREKNASMIDVDDRAVENGDVIKLDFDGSVDGVPFEGGKAENHELTVGSNSFIPGFEEQLVGMNIGEEKDVNVTFPEEYHAKELAGKAAVFKCKVNEIRVKKLPELDDEFAQDVSEFETLEEYRADVKKTITQRKETEAKNKKESAALDKAVENASMDIPAAMIDNQVRQMADEFARGLQSQGLSVEQYMQFTGMTADKLLEQMRPEAEKRIRNTLTLEAIAKAEGIEIGDEDVDAEIQKMAEMYKMEADQVKNLMGEQGLKQIREDLAVQKAVTVLGESAKEV